MTLSPIPDEQRRPERELWAAFEAAKPRLLGALLDDVSAALRARPTVQLQRMPRLADFAVWAVAAEQGRAEPTAFIGAYDRSRISGHEQALESSVVGTALMAFIADDLALEPWQGTAKHLLARLSALGGDAATKQKGWPASPRGLAGMLRALAPALRATGVSVTFSGPAGKQRSRLLCLARADTQAPPDGGKQPSASSAPSADMGAQEERTGSQADGWTEGADDRGPLADGQADGWTGEADVADGRVSLLSVGVGGNASDDWEEF